MPEIPPAEQSVNSMINAIHGIAASHAPVEIGIGVVLALPPSIQVAWNNIILEKEQLYIDVFLLKKYARFSKGGMAQKNERGKLDVPYAKGDIRTSSQSKRGGSGKPSFVSHHHKINNSYKADLEGDYTAESASDYKNSIIYTDWGLNVGDLVTLLPIKGGQQFIITGVVYYMGELTEEMFEDDSNDSSVISAGRLW